MVTVYLDLETGGVLPHHPTIQIGAVAMDRTIEVGAFECKLTFDIAACDPEALKVNGYTPERWKDAVSPAVAVARLSAWVRPFCEVSRRSKAGNTYTVARLAGYNAVSFDVPRLRALFGAEFFPFEFLTRDVLQRVLFYFDERACEQPENFKLTTVASYFCLPVSEAHDALADARTCAAVHRAVKEAW